MAAPIRATERDDALSNQEFRRESRIFVGRQRELNQVRELLHAGASVALRGAPGTGRRSLLRQIWECGPWGCTVGIWPALGTAKAFAYDLARQLDANGIPLAVPERLVSQPGRLAASRGGTVRWEHVRLALGRAPVAQQCEIIAASLREHFEAPGARGVCLFLDHLELPPLTADQLLVLQDLGVQFAAVVETANNRNRITRLLWRAQIIEVPPLTDGDVRTWLERYLSASPLPFDRPRTREAFIRTVQRDSAGVPAVVESMLATAEAAPRISAATVREIGSEAAVTYLDMTPLIIIISAGFMALRYISRGAGLQEMMVLAGVGTSVFWLLMYFSRVMSSKR